MSPRPSSVSTSRPRVVDTARLRRTALAGMLVILALLWLKPTENIVRVPPEWVPWPATLAHYWEVLFSSSRTARIGRAFLNSVIVSLGTVVLVLLTSAMAAYPLARMRFPGRDLVFVVLVVGSSVPARLDAFVQGGIEDNAIEPLAHRHAGAARGLARGVARLPPDPFYLPRNARFHTRIRVLDREEREPNSPGGAGAR